MTERREQYSLATDGDGKSRASHLAEALLIMTRVHGDLPVFGTVDWDFVTDIEYRDESFDYGPCLILM